jgi:hypothetical protein
MATCFMAKMEGRYLVALILAEGSSKPEEMTNFEDLADMDQQVRNRYPSAVRLSSRQFQEELEQRMFHSTEMLKLLQQYSELLGNDLSTYVVYGSPLRPISAVWARIDDAVFMNADKRSTGYHNYVAVPLILDKEIIKSYELEFVSRPQ